MINDIVRKKGYLTLGSRLKRMGERLQADVQQLLNQRDIPIQSSQYPLLVTLEEHGPLAVGDLAVALGVSQPGITRSVGQLARQNLVTIQRGKEDQRTKTVALTKKGKTIVTDGRSHIWPHIEASLGEILSGHSGTLIEQLDILEDALDKYSMPERILNAKNGDNNG
jgi:DNA-binding MarR family transcriptional regulator